jgi:hypothetical protein
VTCRPDEECLLLACDVVVRRALELAGKRLLTREFLTNQSLKRLPQWQIYSRLPRVSDPDRQDEILRGAWSNLPGELGPVIPQLNTYVRSLLATGDLHDAELLRPMIATDPKLVAL